MTAITENEARRLLAESGTPPEPYTAYRQDGGWAFGWAHGEAPMGVRGIVVSDAGRVALLGLGETASAALARLATPET